MMLVLVMLVGLQDNYFNDYDGVWRDLMDINNNSNAKKIGGLQIAGLRG